MLKSQIRTKWIFYLLIVLFVFSFAIVVKSDEIIKGENPLAEPITDNPILEFQPSVTVNEPVKWSAEYKYINPDEKTKELTLDISVPKEALNVKIYDDSTGETKEIPIDKEKDQAQQVTEVKPLEEKTYQIEYETIGPTMSTSKPSRDIYAIQVNSDKDYLDVNAYIDVSIPSDSKITLYWYMNDTDYAKYIDTKVPELPKGQKLYKVDVTKNKIFNLIPVYNGRHISRIKWTIPHLSNQTGELNITILNPYMYMRDNETWTVAFQTIGIANLTISSPNSQWEEMLSNNISTTDEMRYMNLWCGNVSMNSSLLLTDKSHTVGYNTLASSSYFKPINLTLKGYSCDNDISYISNYMNIAGYATLRFDFTDGDSTITQYAYDPTTYWQEQENSNGTLCTGSWHAANTCAKVTDGNWSSYGGASLNNISSVLINYTKPTGALNSSLWEVLDGAASPSTRRNYTIPQTCWAQTILQFNVTTRDVVTKGTYWYCWDGTWQLINQSSPTNKVAYEEKMWWEIPTPSTNSCTYVANGWDINCADGCNITSPVTMIGGISRILNITGTGYVNINTTITGATTINIQGTDATNICTVTCTNGCFS
jgi:hypothetical protein